VIHARRSLDGVVRRLGVHRKVRGIDLPPERGDFDRLRSELDVRETEAASDNPAVAEELLDLVRMR